MLILGANIRINFLLHIIFALYLQYNTKKIQLKPQSVISVIMLTVFVFEQMYCRFEGVGGVPL